MDTSAFLRMVLPSAGWYMGATPLINGRGYRHYPTRDIDALAENLLNLSAQGKNTYFALAGFTQASYMGDDDKRHYRTKVNAESARCFWIDVDCGHDKPYATIQDGFAAYKKFRVDYGLPGASFINVSGNGLHIYWALDQDLPKGRWEAAAHILRSLMVHAEFKADAPLTANIVCVLRPPGTENWKDASNPKRVFINGGTRAPISWKEMGSALVQAKKAHNVELAIPRSAKPQAVTNSANAEYSDGLGDYLPSDANKVADMCPTIRAMRDTKGKDQIEPVWRATMSNLLLTEQGEEVCREWSTAHKDFTEEDFQAKIANLRNCRPYSCETIRTMSPHCKGCKITGTSPIRLGEIRPDHQEEVVDEETGEVEVIPPLPPAVAKTFRWSEKRGLLGTTKDKDGVEQEFVVNEFLIVVDYMWRDENNVGMTHLRARLRPHVWAEGDVPTKMINKGGAHLAGEVGAALNIGINSAANKLLDKLLQTWIQHLRGNTDEHIMRRAMGWQPDGAFLLGNQLYKEDGTVSTAIVGKNLHNMIAAHTPTGNLERYVELIDTLYNRPKREIFQFAYAAGFASILPALFHHQPTGLVLALSSPETGVGKSTIAKLGIGVWGNPNANGQSMKSQAATELAMYTMAGQRRHLPVLIDETTMWPHDQMRKFLYAYSDGTAKLQAKAEGGLRDNSHLHWNNMLYITTNTNVVELLKTDSGNAAPQIARVFEVVVPSLKGTKYALDSRQLKLVRELSQEHYGIAGDAFLRFVVTHKEGVVKAINAKMNSLYKKLNIGTEARFWVMLVACTQVAFAITKKLGLHKFDLKVFNDWIIDRLRDMTRLDIEAKSDAEEVIANMLMEINPGLIVTSTEGGGIHNEPAKGWGHQGAPRIPNVAITGRVISNDKTLQCYIPVSVVKRYCNKYLIDFPSLQTRLRDKGFVEKKAIRYQVTRGLPITAGKVSCWSLDVEKLRDCFTAVIPNSEPTQPDQCTTTDVEELACAD